MMALEPRLDTKGSEDSEKQRESGGRMEEANGTGRRVKRKERSLWSEQAALLEAEVDRGRMFL